MPQDGSLRDRHALCRRTDFTTLFLNHTKAFDRVVHATILQKLQAQGVSGPFLDSQRKPSFVVQVDKDKHKSSPGTYGLIRGFDLGPPWFPAYIIDLLLPLLHKIAINAEDVVILETD